MTVSVTTTTTVDITPEIMAKAFWGMSDQQQADFFIAVAKFACDTDGQHKADTQWLYIGEHLRDCECRT